MAIDSVGWTGSGNATVTAGGGGGGGGAINGNYYIGELVYDDLGGQHIVAGVNPATGGVTSVTTVVQPAGPAGASPTNPRTTTGGTGTNLTLSPTWVAATTLALQPTTGGTITMPALQASTTYANDAAAATGGVAIGQLYRNGSVIQIRVA